jgi:hypothetical protein
MDIQCKWTKVNKEPPEIITLESSPNVPPEAPNTCQRILFYLIFIKSILVFSACLIIFIFLYKKYTCEPTNFRLYNVTTTSVIKIENDTWEGSGLFFTTFALIFIPTFRHYAREPASQQTAMWTWICLILLFDHLDLLVPLLLQVLELIQLVIVLLWVIPLFILALLLAPFLHLVLILVPLRLAPAAAAETVDP